MKKFYTKLALYSIILCFFVFLSTIEMFRFAFAKLTLCEEFVTAKNGPDEIGPYIDKVRENNNYTKLIIGDSVCKQMFTGLQQYNDDICIIGSNAGVTMAGQYILMHEFLDNHINTTDIWLIVIPNSLTGFFDTGYGYMYMAMPNAEKDTLKLLDKNTLEQLESVYGKLFLDPYVVRFLDRSAPARKIYMNLLLKYGKGYGYAPLSPISIQYLDKMLQLCRDRNVTFHLLSGPVSDYQKEKSQKVLDEFQENGFDDRFPDYNKSVKYYPDYQFKDYTHFGGDYENQVHYNDKIKMLADEDLLYYLRFE